MSELATLLRAYKSTKDNPATVLLTMGRAGDISTAGASKTGAQCRVYDRKSTLGERSPIGDPIKPPAYPYRGAPFALAALSRELQTLRQRADFERWGFPAEIAVEMSSLALSLFAGRR